MREELAQGLRVLRDRWRPILAVVVLEQLSVVVPIVAARGFITIALDSVLVWILLTGFRGQLYMPLSAGRLVLANVRFWLTLLVIGVGFAGFALGLILVLANAHLDPRPPLAVLIAVVVEPLVFLAMPACLDKERGFGPVFRRIWALTRGHRRGLWAIVILLGAPSLLYLWPAFDPMPLAAVKVSVGVVAGVVSSLVSVAFYVYLLQVEPKPVPAFSQPRTTRAAEGTFRPARTRKRARASARR